MYRVVIVILGVVFFIIFSGDNKTETETETETLKVDTSHITDLGMTVEEFQVAFNKNARARNVPQMQLNNLEFGTDDKADMFWNTFVDSFYLFGKINPESKKIKELNILKNLVLSGNDRKAETQTAAAAFLIMVQTLSPSLNSEERAAILNKFSASSKPSVAVDIGDIKYSQVILENGNVLMLSADVKD